MEKICKIILSVTDLKSRDEKTEHIITKFPIEIGRDLSCDIVLTDKRKLVSRNHAKIILFEDQIKLIDSGSRNATYINQKKVNNNQEYVLEKNDEIKIGEYLLLINDIHEEDKKAYDSQKTMMFLSPFAEEVENLSACLKNLSEKYSITEDHMRDEYLRMDFLNNISLSGFDNIVPFVMEYFDNKYSTHDEKNKWSDIETPNAALKAKAIMSQVEESSLSEKINKEEYSFKSQFSESFDLLLESVTKLIQGFWQFRQEFFGVTIYQSIPTTSVEKLKEFLFDLSISDKESTKRLKIFKEELNKIQSHQVGLLDGYKDSVNSGIEKVLADVDPEILESKINSEALRIGSINIPLKYIPFYAKIKSIQMLKSRHKKLRLDMNVIERKYFRPAFMKGYQKRINFYRENK